MWDAGGVSAASVSGGACVRVVFGGVGSTRASEAEGFGSVAAAGGFVWDGGGVQGAHSAGRGGVWRLLGGP